MFIEMSGYSDGFFTPTSDLQMYCHIKVTLARSEDWDDEVQDQFFEDLTELLENVAGAQGHFTIDSAALD